MRSKQESDGGKKEKHHIFFSYKEHVYVCIHVYVMKAAAGLFGERWGAVRGGEEG